MTGNSHQTSRAASLPTCSTGQRRTPSLASLPTQPRLFSTNRRIHYAAQFGTHICLPELFLEATLRLKNLQLMHPQQTITPEPEVLDPEEVFNNMGKDEQTSMDDTYLGTDPNAENKEKK